MDPGNESGVLGAVGVHPPDDLITLGPDGSPEVSHGEQYAHFHRGDRIGRGIVIRGQEFPQKRRFLGVGQPGDVIPERFLFSGGVGDILRIRFAGQDVDLRILHLRSDDLAFERRRDQITCQIPRIEQHAFLRRGRVGISAQNTADAHFERKIVVRERRVDRRLIAGHILPLPVNGLIKVRRRDSAEGAPEDLVVRPLFGGSSLFVSLFGIAAARDRIG